MASTETTIELAKALHKELELVDAIKFARHIIETIGDLDCDVTDHLDAAVTALEKAETMLEEYVG